MIEIYFDGVLLNSDNYVKITNDFSQFEDSFFLGSTAANSINIEIPKDCINNIPNQVLIKLDDKNYATLVVDNYQFKENNIISLNLVDKMVNFNFNYDASQIVPCTTKAILQNICEKAGVELGTSNFTNDNIVIDYFDNRKTAREYLSYIAELNGGYAIIGPDGKLYLKEYNSVPVDIEINTCEDFKIGEKHKIERVVFDNGLLKYETSNNENLETLYLNSNNVYITNEEIFNNIANKIINFEFYCFSTSNCKINPNVLAGDLINFKNRNIAYKTIAQYSINYNGCWLGGYSLNIKSSKQAETQYKGLEERFKNLEVEIDRNLNEITQTVEETIEKTETIEQLVDVFKVNLELNNIVISTDENNNPLETKSYSINYEAFYLEDKVICLPTTENTYSGITVTINDSKIEFSVNKNTQISVLDNKYVFKFTYLKDGETYEINKTIIVSLVLQGKAASVKSEIPPEDTNQLWYDTSTNRLKRYDGSEWVIVNDYSSEISVINQNVEKLKNDLKEEINKNTEAIANVTTTYETKLNQSIKGWEAQLSKVESIVYENNNITNGRINEILDYLKYQLEIVDGKETGVVTLGSSSSNIKLKLVNDMIFFEQNGNRVAYISDNKLYITNGQFLNSLIVGNFGFFPEDNGSLSFRKVG